MKSKRKPITNKELERRTVILMMEFEILSHAIDTLFRTVAGHIETNGDSDTWTINVDPTKEDALEYNMIGGYSGGGIPTLARRPNAIPPKRGPVPYGQNIKEGIVSLIK